MAAGTYEGWITDFDGPDWGPLVDLVGEDVAGDFMWMYEVELSDGKRLQAYKHIDTRRYVHLDADGSAFAWVYREHYRRVGVVAVLEAVFEDLHELAGVTDEQVKASRRAVERLRRAA